MMVPTHDCLASDSRLRRRQLTVQSAPGHTSVARGSRTPRCHECSAAAGVVHHTHMTHNHSSFTACLGSLQPWHQLPGRLSCQEQLVLQPLIRQQTMDCLLSKRVVAQQRSSTLPSVSLLGHCCWAARLLCCQSLVTEGRQRPPASD